MLVTEMEEVKTPTIDIKSGVTEMEASKVSPPAASVSSQSSIASTSTTTTSQQQTPLNDAPPVPSGSPSDLVKEAQEFVNGGASDPETSKTIILELVKALTKSRSESNQYKIQAQLLSLSAKDADMRYEVENELVKREVERLKTQNEQVDYLMTKVTNQKQLIKKYKNEIINKNKEINRLKNKINAHTSSAKKRRKSNSPNNGMLDTLGMLASQVLTEEETSTPRPDHSRSFQG